MHLDSIRFQVLWRREYVDAVGRSRMRFFRSDQNGDHESASPSSQTRDHTLQHTPPKSASVDALTASDGASDGASDEEDRCAICLDPLTAQPTETLDGCAHRFHSACIVRSLQRNSACPLCRFRPDTSTSDDDESVAPTEAPSANSEPSAALVPRRRGTSALCPDHAISGSSLPP